MAADAGAGMGDARSSRTSERVATQRLQDGKAAAASTANRSSSCVPKTEDGDHFRVSSKPPRTRRSLSSQRGDASGGAASTSLEESHEASTRKQKRSRGKSRASKHARQQADLDDPKFVRSLKKEINDKTEALPREIRRRWRAVCVPGAFHCQVSLFGEIVWVKLSGYPFWPGLIMDPRKLPPSMQFVALKTIGTKFWMYFYGTHDFAGISYKNVVPWDDKTYPYREGYPQKDLKAPARKEQLGAAMVEADSEQFLPLMERIDWLVKDAPVAAPERKTKREKSSEKEATASSRAAAKSPKENRGGDRRSKPPPKVVVEKQEPKAAAEQSGARKSPVAAGAPRAPPTQRQQSATAARTAVAPAVAKQARVSAATVRTAPATQAGSAPSRGAAAAPPQTSAAPPVETVATPLQTAKAAPSTKPAVVAAPAPAAPAAVPAANDKAAPVQAPAANVMSPIQPAPVVKTVTIPVATAGAAPVGSNVAGGSAASTSRVSGSKRKSPTTTTVSAPASASPQATPPQKNLDKATYTVGPLAVFVDKLRELYAQASTTGNWDIMTMLSQLFNEKVLFRSDLERSGLASAIAEIRKSPNQHVVQTAKAIRVHLMYILKDDMTTDRERVSAARPQKRRKSDSGDSTTNESDSVAVVAGKSADQRKPPASQPMPSAATSSSMPDGIDLALSLIQKVRERAESHPIKPEPERDPSPPHSRRVSAGNALTLPSTQRSRPSSGSSTGSVKRQASEEETRPQPVSGKAAAPAVIPAPTPAPAASAPAPSRTNNVSPRTVVIDAQPPQDVVDLAETASAGQVSAPQPAAAPRQQQPVPAPPQQPQLSHMEPAIYQMSNLPRRRNPALVIFNKDGTLIDFNSMWGGWVESQAWRLEASAKLPIRDLFYGAMGYDWMRRSVTRFGALSTLPKRELAKVAVDVLVSKDMPLVAAQRAVRDCWSYPDPVMTCRPLADVSDIFRTIKQMGIKIAIRTTDNRECTKETLAHLKLTDLVDDMVCGDDGLPAAPAPEQVWALCNRLGVGAYNTVMVGDTPSDMALGHNSACSLSVGVFGGAASLDDLSKEADILISSLDKITRVLFQYGQQASQQ